MGSATSKSSSATAVDGPYSISGPARRRSKIFLASCFGMPSPLADDPDEEEDEENGDSSDEIEAKSARDNERSRKQRNLPLWFYRGDRRIEVGDSSGGRLNCNAATAAADRSLNSSSRSRSRFGFISDRLWFKLRRTASLGASRAQSLSSENGSVQNIDRLDNSVGNDNRNEENDTVEADSLQDIMPVAGHSYNRNQAESGNDDTRRHNRRIGPQEPLEGSLRFSRTLSVGRLRDRVLRRTSSSAGILGSALLEERSEIGYNGMVSERRERRVVGSRRRVPPSLVNEVWPDVLRSHPYHIGSLTDDRQDLESGSLQLGELNNHDLLEHRSAFLERRRRIRSQV